MIPFSYNFTVFTTTAPTIGLDGLTPSKFQLVQGLLPSIIHSPTKIPPFIDKNKKPDRKASGHLDKKMKSLLLHQTITIGSRISQDQSSLTPGLGFHRRCGIPPSPEDVPNALFSCLFRVHLIQLIRRDLLSIVDCATSCHQQLQQPASGIVHSGSVPLP